MLSLSQDCRTAEPVIKATHLLPFKTGCCFEVATLLLGAAKADAQNAIEIATVAHRTDQPHKPPGLITVVMRVYSVFPGLKTRTNKRRFRLFLPQKVFKAKPIQTFPSFVRTRSARGSEFLVDGGRRFPFRIRF